MSRPAREANEPSRRWPRRPLALVAALLWSSLSASGALGAEVTHVATAATALWPVEIDASVGFTGTIEQADISKEQFQQGATPSTLIHGSELSYRRTTSVLPIRVAGGIWHNLELHVMVPIVIDDVQHYDFAPLTNGGALATALTQGSGVCPEGGTSCASGISPGGPQNALIQGVSLPFDSNRGGFTVGDITIGAAWAPLTEEDDPSSPTWLLGFDYVAPNASPMNPTKVSYLSASNGTVADIGDGLHHFHPYTALSKRRGAFDPYVSFWMDFAHAQGTTYDNCQNPFPNSGGDPRSNCGKAPFTPEVTRLQPEYQGGFWFGTEVVPFENAAEFQKIAIDARVVTEYHSAARTYTQLTDLVQALTYQQDYARLGGQVGLYFHASKYLLATVNFALLHDTDHWLTQENFGGPNAPAGSKIMVGSPQQNPNFDFRYDNPGSRFLLQNSLLGSLSMNLEARF